MPLDAIDALNQNPLPSPFQHSLISSLASLMQSTPAAGLDRERAKAEVAGKRVPTIHIGLPHTTNLGTERRLSGFRQCADPPDDPQNLIPVRNHASHGDEGLPRHPYSADPGSLYLSPHLNRVGAAPARRRRTAPAMSAS